MSREQYLRELMLLSDDRSRQALQISCRCMKSFFAARLRKLLKNFSLARPRCCLCPKACPVSCCCGFVHEGGTGIGLQMTAWLTSGAYESECASGQLLVSCMTPSHWAHDMIHWVVWTLLAVWQFLNPRVPSCSCQYASGWQCLV